MWIVFTHGADLLEQRIAVVLHIEPDDHRPVPCQRRIQLGGRANVDDGHRHVRQGVMDGAKARRGGLDHQHHRFEVYVGAEGVLDIVECSEGARVGRGARNGARPA